MGKQYLYSGVFILSFFWVSLVHADEKPTMNLVIGQVESTSTPSSDYLMAGFRITLPQGWKTYWKFTPESGKTFSVDASQSSNINEVEVLWPTPDEFNFMGYQVYGYHDFVVIPIKIYLKDKTKPYQLDLKTTLLFCNEDSCNETHFNHQYNPRHPNPSIEVNPKLIQQYVSYVPQKTNLATLTDVQTSITHKGKDYFYTINITGKSNSAKIEAFLVPDNKIALTGFSNIQTNKDNTIITIPFTLKDESVVPDKSLSFDITLSNGKYNIEYTDYKNLTDVNLPLVKIIWVLFCGFLGGVILNCMPCVLPILLLKTIEVLNTTKEDSVNSRMSHIMSGLGILFTFMLFACMTILVSQLGHIATWGMHFQNPLFVFIMSVIMVILACNLLGFYEISFPTFFMLSNEMKGNIGNLMNGMVITLLAIPCSAPFLATAASYGLSQPPLISLIIFFAIGLGFSSPYFLLASAPSVLKKILPKPGKWMLTLKQIAGGALIGTSAWLLWILTGMLSYSQVMGILILLISLFTLIFFIRNKPDRVKNIVWSSMLACVISFSIAIHPEITSAETISSHSEWVMFDPNKIQAYVNEDKTVFLVFTAKWCITCKFNERTVLDSQEVKNTLTQPNVVAMKADYTNANPVIAKFLRNYNQSGVPCYIVFSHQYPQGKILNPLLTKSLVIDAIKG